MIYKARFIFWDVQHGHSTYISTPNGKNIVIDLGTGDYSGSNFTFSPLLFLKSNGITDLAYVGITHPHKDHIDDILRLRSFNVETFARPRHLKRQDVLRGIRPQDKAIFDEYFRLDDNYSVPLRGGDPSTDINVFGGLRITPFVATDCSVTNLNNQSICYVVSLMGMKVIIPGDNEKASFDSLLRSSAFRDAIKNTDVLLAPHHGRESGYHNDFLTLANPNITVISDGRFCDTSATGRYCAKTRGWPVYSQSNADYEKRFCLTTRNDGEVSIDLIHDTSTNINTMSVEIS